MAQKTGPEADSDATQALFRRFGLLLLYFFVFATGAAGLIYEVTWQKYLSRLLGSDTIATSIIMGVFLGGLSLGYYLCGKLSAKITRHLKVYAALEAIIAIWCMSFPSIFSVLYSLTESWSFEPPFFMIIEGVLCTFALIGIPTICMGATVPILTRGISTSLGESTVVHARVYGINTFGAFVGTLAAGFFLIPWLGLPITMLGVALLNLSAAVCFYLLSLSQSFQSVKASNCNATADDQKTDASDEARSHAREARSHARFPRILLYPIAFLSGFYVMTMENVLFRVANLSFGSSSYSFSMVLSVFLVGIAIGSFAVSKLRRISSTMLFLNLLVMTLLLIGVYLTLDSWPYWSHLVRILFQSNTLGFKGYYVCSFIGLLLILLLPLVFAGATLPIAFHVLKDDLNNVGRHSGLLLSWNTVGNLLGSILGGMVFFYFFDCPQVFLTAVVLSALSALLASWTMTPIKRITAAGVFIVSVVMLVLTPFYDKTHFSKATFRHRAAVDYSYDGADRFFSSFLQGIRILFQDDGPVCTVAVLETPSRDKHLPASRAIMVNGKSDSNTIGDIHTLRLSAHLPALFARAPEKALVVGLGTGVTVGQLALYDEIKQIDVAEISPGIIEALPFFNEATGEVQKDKRVVIHAGDAFRVLSRSRTKWDILISEPSNPWVTGVDMLFTEDFYKLAKEHMTPGGIFLQWAQTYAASPELLGMIANTLSREFKEVYAFIGNSSDLLLLASNQPITANDIARAEKTLQGKPEVKSALNDIDIESIDTLLLRQVWSPTLIRDLFWTYGVQTLDNPRLHYLAGKDFFLGKKVPANTIMPFESSFRVEEYLLARKYPDWAVRKLLPKEVYSYWLSARGALSQDSALPARKLIKLKAHLADPKTFQLTPSDEIEFNIPLLRQIGKLQDDEATWEKLGMKNTSIREKAELMINYLNEYRKWITPFPIDGLKDLLEKGIESQQSARKQNWFVLHLTRLLLLERADIPEAKRVFSLATRNKNNQLILFREDNQLLKQVATLWPRSPEASAR
ncbi:MAG: hypothetical protein GY854_01240 [Deltaproteobacteria bacterium]|nr:hypothetical protein [Deltaproteobacteria bacterium]